MSRPPNLTLKKVVPLLLAMIAGLAVIIDRIDFPASQGESNSADAVLLQAFEQQRSDLQVTGSGVVKVVLADDKKGSRHQRFILEAADGLTVLVAHNIDLAPRVANLRRGDRVEFSGEYEWNDKGGVIHWTHHDPANRHVSGWLRHAGRLYQ